ncbi:Lrp/AsnC ligand binding domain-containing protein [Candidatus Bathyarchaeota archaeon]|nr:Lrp/AsnC ligand binding domain-containing protein [Candidatus Bathyarchaeota archaeon]
MRMGVLVSACILIRTEHGRFEDVVKSVSQVKGVKRVFPVLGRYDVVVDVEAANMKELSSTVLRISRLSGVVFTETLVEVEGA